MTIRTKLALNVCTVLLIVAAIVIASSSGMRSVEANIWALTQKSTPFQLRSIELEKAVQSTVGALGSANGAGSVEELKAHRTEADRSLAEVKQSLADLKALAGEQGGDVYGELNATAVDLIAVADSRLKAQEEAETASRAAQDKLKDALTHLKTLAQRIDKLRQDTAARFQATVTGMKESTASARDIEALKLSVATIRVLLFQIAKADDTASVGLFEGKSAGELDGAFQNPYARQSEVVREALQGFKGKLQELVAKKTAYLGKPADDLRQEVESLARDADDTISDMILLTLDDSAKFKNHYESEARRQDEAFKVQNAANSVLVGGMELGALGRGMDSLAARLFTASSRAEVTAIEAEMKGLFDRAGEVGKRLSGTLSLVQAKGDVAVVNGVVSELGAIFQLVAGSEGVAAKVARSLELNDKARLMSRRLLETAARQTDKSRKSVQSARGDQEGAIRAVNDSLRKSTQAILWSGLVAVLFGLGFGFWIYRSISQPLRALSRVASEVERTGDFSKRIAARGRDEIASTVHAFNTLLESLNRVIRDVNRVMANVAQGDLTSSIEVEARGDMESLKKSINASISTLNGTLAALGGHARHSAAASAESTQAVEQVAQSARQQLDAVSRIAAAIQESAATMSDVAGNTDTASTQAQRASTLVRAGQTKVEDMSRAMNAISANSDRISGITGLIVDIADQTNLLALNAAIEAARAGEHGRGFAVVAEEVTKLAERVTVLARDIAAVIRSSVEESAVAAREATEVRAEMERIAGASTEIGDMLQRIATAVEEQSATVNSLSDDVGTLNEIAEGNASASEQLASTLARLAKVGDEANRQVAYFRT